MEKLVITGLKTADANSGEEYKLQLNPESIKHNRALNVEAKDVGDTEGPVNQYKSYGDETMDLDFVIDGTGAIPGFVSVDAELEKIVDLVYRYEGDIHMPNYLLVTYGKFTFRCLMTAFAIEYLLFDRSGSALRARVTMSLKSLKVKAEKKSSPDMSHTMTIREGDSLPLLCKDIYGKMDYYLQVAEHNGLTNFRELEIGSTIEFPPLQR